MPTVSPTDKDLAVSRASSLKVVVIVSQSTLLRNASAWPRSAYKDGLAAAYSNSSLCQSYQCTFHIDPMVLFHDNESSNLSLHEDRCDVHSCSISFGLGERLSLTSQLR